MCSTHLGGHRRSAERSCKHPAMDDEIIVRFEDAAATGATLRMKLKLSFQSAVHVTACIVPISINK